MSAENAYAAMTRQQWADYVNTFVPLENKLISFATSRTAPEEAAAQASKDVGMSFDAQTADAAHRLKSYGITQGADEQMAAQRATGLARSLADVQAQNTARELTRERQMAIIGNPAPAAVRGGV